MTYKLVIIEPPLDFINGEISDLGAGEGDLQSLDGYAVEMQELQVKGASNFALLHIAHKLIVYLHEAGITEWVRSAAYEGFWRFLRSKFWGGSSSEVSRTVDVKVNSASGEIMATVKIPDCKNVERVKEALSGCIEKLSADGEIGGAVVIIEVSRQ